MLYIVGGTTGVSINFYKGSKIPDSMFKMRISRLSLNISQILIEEQNYDFYGSINVKSVVSSCFMFC